MEKDCQARKLNKEVATEEVDKGCEWLNVSSGTSPLG